MIDITEAIEKARVWLLAEYKPMPGACPHWLRADHLKPDRWRQDEDIYHIWFSDGFTIQVYAKVDAKTGKVLSHKMTDGSLS